MGAKFVRGHLKCDGTPAESRFRLSAKRASSFKSAEASVQSTTGSRGVRISGSNAGYTMFRGSVKGTGYPLHSPVSPSLPLPCVTVYHHISAGVYNKQNVDVWGQPAEQNSYTYTWIGRRIELHNRKFHSWFPLPDMVRLIRSRRLRLVGLETCMW